MRENITFEQIPGLLGEIESKIDYVISQLNASVNPAHGRTENPDELMTLEEACKFIGKKPSTIYSMTSERRIPFMKRGNKLYFMKSDLLAWIKSGNRCIEPYDSKAEADSDFEAHLQLLSSGKRHKPSSLYDKP